MGEGLVREWVDGVGGTGKVRVGKEGACLGRGAAVAARGSGIGANTCVSLASIYAHALSRAARSAVHPSIDPSASRSLTVVRASGSRALLFTLPGDEPT